MPSLRSLCTTFDPTSSLVSAPKTKDGAVKLYDDWASSYDESLRDWEYRVPATIARMVRDAAVPKDVPILDCGCGTGLVGEEMAALGFDSLTGIDVSPESIVVAAKKQGAYDELIVCDLEEALPFDADSFDAIVCAGVLSYVHNLPELCHEWRRVLRPGGIVIFTHRTELWDTDEYKFRSAAESLVAGGAWTMEEETTPQEYMPNNPDEGERNKTIRYVSFRMSQ